VKSFCLAAAAFIAMLAGIHASSAATFAVLSSSVFDALTTGQATTGFNGVATGFSGAPCASATPCFFQGYDPLVVNGISFDTAPGETINVNSAGYYGPGDLTNQYVVNSSTHFVTITLPSAVTAFGLDYGSLFDPSTATFALSNGFSVTNIPTVGNLQTQFIGFLSDVAFNEITLTMPDPSPGNAGSFVVADVTTAVATTPIPATLPLMLSALGGFGFVGYRRRKAAAL
jgi:hypothetical protein